MTGYIHSIETAGNDGTGYVLFLQGCGLRCKLCNNPDNWQNTGKAVEVKEIIDDLKSSKNTFEPGEGLTVSGGEPLLQSAFVKELFIETGKLGIHRTLDTTGFCKEADLLEVLPHTDQVLFTVIVVDPKKHLELAKSGNADILKNLRLVAESRVQLVLCYVLIPASNDAPEDAQDLADLVKSLKRDIPVNVLAYSKLEADKWAEAGLCDPFVGVAPATQKQVELFQAGLSHLGVNLYNVHRWGNILSDEGLAKFTDSYNEMRTAE